MNTNEMNLHRLLAQKDAEIERLNAVIALEVEHSAMLAKEIEQLREESDGLRNHLKAFEDSGGVAAHAEVFRRGAEIERLTKKIEVQGRNVKALVKIAITKDHQIEQLDAEIERLKQGWRSESDKFIAELRDAYAEIKRLKVLWYTDAAIAKENKP
jgi:predicted RNase H-like nuclease (RuvC/YqgF family)